MSEKNCAHPEDGNDDPDVAEFELSELQGLVRGVEKHGRGHIHQLDRFSGEGCMHTYATSLKLLKALLRLGGDVNHRDIQNRTPLMHAVMSVHSNLKAAKLLVDNNAGLLLADVDGYTAWDYAINHPQPSREIILLLLGRGAKPLLRDLSRIPSVVSEWLNDYVNLLVLCVSPCIPRFYQCVRLSTDCIRRLRHYLH